MQCFLVSLSPVAAYNFVSVTLPSAPADLNQSFATFAVT